MDTKFPVSGLMPKGASGVNSFLEKFSSYNGSDVTVAIFDTGCDVAAEGLRFLPDGVSPKFVDAIDTTGSGDVDMSLCVEPQDGKLIGLTGRTLTLNPKWVNPTNKYYIGFKQLRDISPGTVQAALTEDRTSTRDFALKKQQGKIETEIKSIETQLEGLDADSTDAAVKSNIQSLHQYKSELNLRLEALNKYYSTQNDSLGPVLDCILWHNGTEYCAAVDTLELGDFTHPQIKVLRDYALHQEYDTFNYVSQFTYSIKIYAEDKDNILLSIVVAGGTHGTHVASIVGSFWGENDPRNGNAPGVKLITVKIGDSFLSTMETQSGILRGLLESVYTKCDLVNMSYGEATGVPNFGAIQTYVNEVVTKYGVIFVSSNGNEGPCLTTSGAPGGTSEHSISVAAAIEPEMMESQYSIKQTGLNSPKNYHWSSRGPTFDGAMCSISALGAAYASVPRYNTQFVQQMNGTSMSSPACCGILALALSAMKQKGYKYTVHRIRHAMEQSATFLKDNSIFAQGNGLIQIEHMVKYLDETIQDPAFDLYYKIAIQDVVCGSEATTGLRGIYIRQPDATKITSRWMCSVTPVFPKYQYEKDQERESDISQQKETKDLLQENNNTTVQVPTTGPLAHMPRYGKHQHYAFSRCVNFRFKLQNGSIVKDLDWVEVAKHSVITATTKSFPIMVHPQNLAPGAHFVWLQAVLANDDPNTTNPESAGRVIYQVPITVVVPTPSDLETYQKDTPSHYSRSTTNTTPIPLPYTWTFNQQLSPLYCPTNFVQVPTGASFVTCKITALEKTPSALGLWFSTNTITQLKEDKREFELLRLSSDQPSCECAFPVTPNHLMEFSLMYPWTCQGTGIKVKLELAFHGVSFGTHGNSSQSTTVAIPSTDAPYPVTFSAIGSFKNFLPKLSFKTAAILIKPSKSQVFKVADSKVFTESANCDAAYSREILPHQSNMWGTIIEYQFKITGDKPLKGSFDFNAASGLLYESIYWSQNTRIYDDATKSLFHVNDCFTERRYKDYPPGSYTAHVYIKHTSQTQLEALSTATASFFCSKLPEDINIPVRSTYQPGSRQLKAIALTSEHVIGGVVFPDEIQSKIAPKLGQFDVFYGSFTPIDEDAPVLQGLSHRDIGVKVVYQPTKGGDGADKKKKSDKASKDVVVPYSLAQTLKADEKHVKAMKYVVKKAGKKDGDDEKKATDDATTTSTTTTTTTKTDIDEDTLVVDPIKVMNKEIADWSLTEAPAELSKVAKFMETHKIKALESIDKKTDDAIITELYTTEMLPLLKNAHYAVFQADHTAFKKTGEVYQNFVKMANIALAMLSCLTETASLQFVRDQFQSLLKIFNRLDMLTQIGIYSQLEVSQRPNSRPIFPDDAEKSKDDQKKDAEKADYNDELIGFLGVYSTLHVVLIDALVKNFISTITQLDTFTTTDVSVLALLTELSTTYNRYKTAMTTAAPIQDRETKKLHKNLNILSEVYDDLITFFKAFITTNATNASPTVIAYASLLRAVKRYKFDDEKKDPIALRATAIIESLFKPLQTVAQTLGLGGNSPKPTQAQVQLIKAVTVKDGAVDDALTQLLVILADWSDVEALSTTQQTKLVLSRPRRFC